MGSGLSNLPAATRAALPLLLLAARLQQSSAEEWRVYNAGPVQGAWHLSEFAFYGDSACTQRLDTAETSGIVSPGWRAPVLHPSEDCWGKCSEGTSGYCAWCGQGNACCKRGFAGDPAECKHALGFTSDHHECVAVAPGIALTGRAAPGGRLQASCQAPNACLAGALALSATASSGSVRCVVLSGTSPNGAVASAPGTWRLEHSLRLSAGCPGLCRSGRYVEGGPEGICAEFLSLHGWCGGSPDHRTGTDCSGCRGLLAPNWQESSLVLEAPRPGSLAVWSLPAAADVPHRGEDCWGKCAEGMSGICSWCGPGNACCKKGFASDPPACARAVGFTSEHHECVRLSPAPTPAPPPPPAAARPTGRPAAGALAAAASAARWRPLRAATLLHEGEDCWGRCSEGTSGLCSWCGEGNACCKRGFSGDPAECQRAAGFVSEHHECVRLQPEPAMLGQWAIPSLVIVAAWVAACLGARQLFVGSPVVKPKPLEGEVDLHWRRRNRDEAALRRELTEKAKRLTWLGFHV